MLKKILLTLAIIAVLVTSGLYYVNKILLPVQVKGMAIKAAEEALGRKVTFDTLQYNVLNGFVIKDLTVYSKDNPDEIFVHIDRACAQVLFPALLQKKIVLPTVSVDNLSARVIRLNANAWNFSDLLTPRPGAPAASGAATEKPMDLVITGLSVNNARIKLTDLVGGDGFSEMIEPINIRGSLALTGGIRLNGNIGIPSTKGSVIFTIHAGVNNRNIKADIQLENIVTDKYLRFIPDSISVPVKTLNIAKTNITVFIDPASIAVSGNALLNNIDAEPLPGMKTRGTLGLDKIFLTVKKDEVNFQGTVALQDASLETSQGQKFSASIKSVGTNFAMKGKDWTLSTDADIKGLAADIGAGQKAQADITLAQLSASQTGADITAKADITVKNLTAQIPGISIKSTLNAPGTTFELKQGTMAIAARPIFNMLNLSLPQGMAFTGAPAMGVHVTIPPAGQGELRYNGTVQLNNGVFKGLPIVGDVRDIRGTVELKTNAAVIKALSFSVLGTPIEVSGTARNFTDLDLDMKAEVLNLDLGLIEKIIPQIIKDNGLAIGGTADIHADITGKANALDKKGLKVTAALKNMNITSDKLKGTLNNVNGTIIYNTPTLTWNSLTLGFQGKTYTLNGYLEDFLNPLVATSVKTDNMSIDTQVKKTGDTLNIETFNATWFDSSASATGKVFIPPGKAPSLNIAMTAKASLRDIPKMIPEFIPPAEAKKLVKQVEDLKLAGVLKVTARVKGDPVNWQRLESTFNIETPALNVMGYTINDITLDATQNNGELRPLEIKGKLYDGDLGVIGQVDLVKPNFPFESTFKLNGTNLELLKRDTPLKNQQLSGSLTVAGEIKGTPGDLKSLDGKTTVQITDGYLWDLAILSKVLSIMSSSFQGGSVVIREANATFNIKDGKVETNNLTLSSATVSLIGEGWLDMLDQSIDFNITPRLETPASNGTGTDLISVINPTQGLVNIHLTGTLTKPQFEHNISAPTIIKKTLQNTVGGLLKLFE